MAGYEYQARDRQMGFAEGKVQADDEAGARAAIERDGLVPLWVWPAKTPHPRSVHVANFRPVRDDGMILEYAASRSGKIVGAVAATIGAGLFTAGVFVARIHAWWAWLTWVFAAPFLLFGTLLVLFGLGVGLMRQRLSADRVTRELVRDNRFGRWRFNVLTARAADLAAVVLSAEENTHPGGDNNTVTARVFRVSLRRADGSVEELDTSSAGRLQYEMAHKVAEYLGVPFEIVPEIKAVSEPRRRPARQWLRGSGP